MPNRAARAAHPEPRLSRAAWPADLVERLAAENIHVAPRLGRMRISPHVYNDEADVDRFVEAFRKIALSLSLVWSG